MELLATLGVFRSGCIPDLGPGTKTGNFIGKSNFIRQVYALLLARAGVAYPKFHTFRHTHARIGTLGREGGRARGGAVVGGPAGGDPENLRAPPAAGSWPDCTPA
jgi:integrase